MGVWALGTLRCDSWAVMWSSSSFLPGHVVKRLLPDIPKLEVWRLIFQRAQPLYRIFSKRS